MLALASQSWAWQLPFQSEEVPSGRIFTFLKQGIVPLHGAPAQGDLLSMSSSSHLQRVAEYHQEPQSLSSPSWGLLRTSGTVCVTPEATFSGVQATGTGAEGEAGGHQEHCEILETRRPSLHGQHPAPTPPRTAAEVKTKAGQSLSQLALSPLMGWQTPSHTFALPVPHPGEQARLPQGLLKILAPKLATPWARKVGTAAASPFSSKEGGGTAGSVPTDPRICSGHWRPALGWAHAHSHIFPHAHVCTCMHTQTHTLAECTPAPPHTDTYAHRHTCTCLYICVYAHTCTHSTHISAHAHACAPRLLPAPAPPLQQLGFPAISCGIFSRVSRSFHAGLSWLLLMF